MPHGQWVAFEGYDKIHDCKRPTNQRDWKKESSGNHSNGVDFIDFNYKKTSNQNNVLEKKSNSKVIIWILIFCAALVMLYLLSQK